MIVTTPVKQREPVLASAGCKYRPNAGEVIIKFELSKERTNKDESEEQEEFLPETEKSDDGNENWFLDILQTWLVKQGG